MTAINMAQRRTKDSTPGIPPDQQIAGGARQSIWLLTLAQATTLLVLALVAIMGLRTHGALADAAVEQQRAYETLVALRLLRQHVGETRVGLTGYALTGDSLYRNTYRSAVNALGRDTARLAGLIDRASLTAAFPALAAAVAAYAADMATAMAVVERGGASSARQLRTNRNTILLEGVRTQIVTLEEALHAQLDTSAARVRTSVRAATGVVLVSIALGAVVVLLAGAALAAQFRAREQDRIRLRRLNVELEARVIARTADLAAANEELDAFVAAAAHDLRAPLRAIGGYCRLVVEEHGAALGSTGRGDLETIMSSVQRMARLLEDLLALSRTNRAPLSRHDVDITALARSVADDLRRHDPGRAATFAIADGLRAAADPGLMRVVFENLLGNAWKFTRGRDAMIEVGTTGGAFFVRDNGAGFDMSYAHKLFAPFERLHSASEFEGTGVGLTTVRRIIERHGGTVWGEGATGAGATISFTLGPLPDREDDGPATSYPS